MFSDNVMRPLNNRCLLGPDLPIRTLCAPVTNRNGAEER